VIGCKWVYKIKESLMGVWIDIKTTLLLRDINKGLG
jgi:hypothetical protein